MEMDVFGVIIPAQAILLTLWVVFVEMSSTITYWKRYQKIQSAIQAHLDVRFPPVWNEESSTDIVLIDRASWQEKNGLTVEDMPSFPLAWKYARLTIGLVVVLSVLSGYYWGLVLLGVAVSVFAQERLRAITELSHKVFDLHEQPWITRNKKINSYAMSQDNHPESFDLVAIKERQT